jgi:hypothetical protein
MKGKLLVIAFAGLALVAGTLTFEPSVTNAKGSIKPSATPRRVKAVSRKPTTKATVFQGLNVNPVVNRNGTATTVPTNQGIKRKPPRRNGRANSFGDTPGLNGGDMITKTKAPANQYSGTPTDGQGIKRRRAGSQYHPTTGTQGNGIIGDPTMAAKAGTKTNPYSGAPTDGSRIKRKAPKGPDAQYQPATTNPSVGPKKPKHH